MRGKQQPLKVWQADLPHEPHPDRLVLINNSFYSLDKLVSGLARKLDATPVYGLRFLADDAGTSSEYRNKSIVGHVASYKDVRRALTDVAEKEGVKHVPCDEVEIQHLDESGVDVRLGKTKVRAKALVIAGHLAADQQKMIGMPESWGEGVLHRHTFALLKMPKGAGDSRSTIPMSLDLKGTLSWGWMLQSQTQVQVSISQPLEEIAKLPPLPMLQHWANVLHSHAVIKDKVTIAGDEIRSIDLPLAGALAHEGVANRTLLVGPAGGFYSACSEDVYPNCWSAVFAAEAMKKALEEKHLQDALNGYRFAWRTTLGDYLRGPQQNLRFLLPLVYRNQVMTARLSESILMGKSVVR